MKKVSVLILVLVLGACVGTSRQSKFYSLAVENAGVITAPYKNGLSVGVKEVKVPSYVDKPQMVTQNKTAVELSVSELNRWSEPLGTMLQRTIAEDMALVLPRAAVKGQMSVREKFDYTVSVEVNKFDGQFGGEAVLEAWWYIRDAQGNTVVLKRTELSEQLGKTYDDLAMVQSNLIAKLSRQIALQIVEKSRKQN